MSEEEQSDGAVRDLVFGMVRGVGGAVTDLRQPG